jgi:hypothetical protein
MLNQLYCTSCCTSYSLLTFHYWWSLQSEWSRLCSLCFRSFVVSLWALKNLAELSNRPSVCMRWQGQDLYFVLYQSAIPVAVQVTWSQSSVWKFGWPETDNPYSCVLDHCFGQFRWVLLFSLHLLYRVF